MKSYAISLSAAFLLFSCGQSPKVISDIPFLRDVNRLYGAGTGIKTSGVDSDIVEIWEVLPVSKSNMHIQLLAGVSKASGKRSLRLAICGHSISGGLPRFGNPDISMEIPENQIDTVLKSIDIGIVEVLFSEAAKNGWTELKPGDRFNFRRITIPYPSTKER